MGVGDVNITAKDMYDEIVGMRGDVQRVVILLGGTEEKVSDHEGRLRRLEDERQDYVTEDDVRERTSRSLVICATIAGAISTIVGVTEFVISHR